MEYHPQLNLLLEALSYLGRRAGGYTIPWLVERLESRGVLDLESLRSRLTPIETLMEELEDTVDAGVLNTLFGNLPGFAHNTTGTYSPAFLLLYPLIGEFDGDMERIAELARNRTPERLAGDLANTLDISEEITERSEMSGDDFAARVLALSIPAESKVKILDLYHHPEAVLEPALALLKQVLERLERSEEILNACCASFLRELDREGPEGILTKTSALSQRPDGHYQVHPFLFGMDTNLAVTSGTGPVRVYCGILRRELQEALDSARGPEYDVYNAIRLLADRTRFDILCYLRDRDAYGQELAAKFGLSRNTIHHHMTKLLAAHLVKCSVDGNRVYYTVDQVSVAALMDRQRDLLLPDHTKK